jgi:hypothetical protein
VGDLSLRSDLIGSIRDVLKRGGKPTGYLHSRTNKHSPQRQLDLQDGGHAFLSIPRR